MTHFSPNQWHEINQGFIYWSPNFIEEPNADALYHELLESVDWQSDDITLFGKTMPIPRLQAWYGEKAYQYSNLVMKPKPWLPTLFSLKEQCEQIADTKFNSVLTNLYRDGNDSNGWHSDNEPELGLNPVIASLSFGEARTFHLKHRVTKGKLTFELTSGSLLIMAGELQQHWLHTVPKTKRPKSPRINLTYRTIID
ncbi:alpha-ketoglutarate-dependent dioxygenase AlkB family protein [Vibrio profundi]|uniref:alpha-ketoglutarate-dependent dioxygenase AlkB family protein n=1 Tax=Vibrio profundi TaxID=1774960 RepID=UPI0037364900